MRSIYGSALAIAVLSLMGPAAASAESITGLTASPAEGQVGDTISVVASGSGLCGALHVDWGDGAAITYATSQLPITQTHVYQTAGAYVIRARGMGNCTGEALTRVTIKPAPARPALAALEVAPTPAPVRTAATITLRGSGTCRVDVDFGDGNSQTVAGELPLTVRHTYALPRAYTIVAVPQSPCAERRTAVLEVIDPAARTRITGMQVSSPSGGPSGVRSLRIDGTGQCTYTLDYGDGNTESRTAALPDAVPHNYPASGRYEVVATATAPCAGSARAVVTVGNTAARGTITRVEVQPALARPDDLVEITVAGSGTCQFTVNFGDGQSTTLTASLPHQLAYVYDAPGTYPVLATADRPCSGEAAAAVRVRRR